MTPAAALRAALLALRHARTMGADGADVERLRARVVERLVEWRLRARAVEQLVEWRVWARGGGRA